MESTSLRFVPYKKNAYDYRSFCCGEGQLDDWLGQYAGQNQKRWETRTYLLVNSKAESREIYGYFAMQPTQILPDEASLVRGRGAKYPMPATHLVKLAISDNVQRQGLGGRLIAEAMRISLEAAELIGSVVLIVDAINENAKSFYSKYGFTPLQNDSMRMFMPMKTIMEAFS